MSADTEFLDDAEKFLEIILGVVDEDEDGGLDREDARYSEESRLPAGAVLLASFTDEVENWTTWELETYLYLCPIPKHVNSYALVILSWDDNWERWDWEIPLAIGDQTDATSAKGSLLEAFVKERCDPKSDSAWDHFLKSLVE
jgi:hypothetical protein